MAIDTNALTLGSSLPAKGSFQTGADADPNAQTGGSTPGGQNCASDTSLQAPSTAPKSTGPAAQTRANARSGGAAAPATAAAGTASDPTTAAAEDSDKHFSTVMATALGRSATSGAEPAALPKAATRASDSTTPAQPAATPGADAVAWIAQLLMPAAAAQPGGTPAIGSAQGSSASASASTSATAPASGPATAVAAILPGLANTAATTANLTAAAAAGALRNPINDEFPAQAPATQQGDVQTTAMPAQATTSDATLGSITALADVQKLISGMTAATGARADDGGDASAGAPAPHASSASDGTDGAPAAAALQAAGLTRSDGSLGHATLTIQAPVAAAGFADEVSARVAGLAQSGLTQAQLQLSPAELGPVQVHITLQSGQASVWFGANHADTRAALEQSLPRLRELFAGAGMPLTDSGVFREPPQQPQTQSLPASGSARASDDTVTAPTVTPVSNIRLALLDTYA